MKSVFWLIENSIAGRPGPLMAPWDIVELQEEGFTAIINLSENPSDEHVFRRQGLAYHWIPLPTDIPPNSRSEALCLEALPKAYAALTQTVSSGGKALIHCYAGVDRTGMLLSLYLAKTQNLPAEEALRRVRLVRPRAITSLGWEPMALRVIAECCKA